MSGSLLPTSQQWFDNNGNPLAGGKIYTYVAGTSTPKASYSDYALTSANPNPVILDSAGRASIWGAGGFKLVVKTSAGTTLYTQDNVFASGAEATVVGDFSVTGGSSSFADGRFTVDTSGYTPTPADPSAWYWSNTPESTTTSL